MDALNQSRNPLPGGPAPMLSGGTRSLMAAPNMSSQYNNHTSGLNGASVLCNATFGFGSGPSSSSLWSPNDLVDTIKASSANSNSVMWPTSGNGAPEMSSNVLGSLANSNSTANALQSQPPCHIDTWKTPTTESTQNNIWSPQNTFTTASASTDSTSSNIYNTGMSDSMASGSCGDTLKKAPSSSTSGSVHGSVGGSTGHILSRPGRVSSSERLANARAEELTPAEVAARAEQQRKIDELINNPHGWGSHSVDQTTEWDVTMLKDKFKDSTAASRGESHTESNVWCAGPPTGVNIWEDHYESVGQNTSRWNRSGMNATIGSSTVSSLNHPVQPGMPWESASAGSSSIEGSHLHPGNLMGSATSVVNRAILPQFNSNMVNANNLASKLSNLPLPSNSIIPNPLNRAEPSTRAVYLEKLKAMGFGATLANEALIRCDMDWDKTLALLMAGSVSSQPEAPISSNNAFSSGMVPPSPFNNNNSAQVRQNVVALEQTLQALISQEKTVASYLEQSKTRMQELNQRIFLISRTPAAAQSPHILQPLQVDYNQMMQQQQKLESMQTEIRFKSNQIRQRILQAQADAQQQQQQQQQQMRGLTQSSNMNSYGLSLPTPMPNMTMPQPSSTSISNYPNPSVFSAHGVRLSTGYLGNSSTVINAPGNQKPVQTRNFLPPSVNDPALNFSPSLAPPQTFSSGTSFTNPFQNPPGPIQAPNSVNNSFLPSNATPVAAGASGGMASTWTVTNTPSMDSLLSQIEDIKISTQTSNNNLSDIPEFVPGQRWSGIKDDSTTVMSSSRNFFAVKTDHLERLAHSPADNDVVSPPHSTRLPVNSALPLMNGHGNLSSWFLITEFPANNHNAVEYYRQQLVIQLSKLTNSMSNGAMDSSSAVVRCHWHPIQRWLLICVSEGPDAVHTQAILQALFMPPSKVELLSEKLVRHYLSQLRPFDNGPRPMLGNSGLYPAQAPQTQPSQLGSLPPYNAPPLGNPNANYFNYPPSL